MADIPERFVDLLSREKKAFAFLALVKRDGTPQVTPLWFDYDGTHIIINTARRRVKDRILSKHPAVAMAIPDPGNPYRYVQIRGKVVEQTEVGGYEMICHLNEKYHGKYEYPKRPGEVRVTYKILPEHFAPK
ncbi:MAG: pyridoxamine 5'-phosphate oxidase family protein [Chloroflexota bacterium]|nr:pyridoxamine 5'-phosphate oxidase family protein [Chloroflexota bacterium]